MRNTIAGALALLLIPIGLAGQATDSVTIEVLGPPTSIAITAPERAYVGDTVQVAFQVVDQDGQPTAGVVTWSVRPEANGRVVAQTDSTVSVELLARGTVTLLAEVTRLDRLVIGGRYEAGGLDAAGLPVDPGTFQWADAGPFRLEVGGSAALCVAGLAGDRALLVSSPDCYDNLATLVGVVPPLSSIIGEPIRRAGVDATMIARPVILRPDFMELAGLEERLTR